MPRALARDLIMDAKSALGEKAFAPNSIRNAERIVFYITFSPGTTAGTIVIEESDDANFTGTPITVSTVAWAAANRIHIVNVQGPSEVMWARISSAILGGTVKVRCLVLG